MGRLRCQRWKLWESVFVPKNSRHRRFYSLRQSTSSNPQKNTECTLSHQSNEDGKIVIWFRDTDDSPDGHYIGIYDLDSEDYDNTLELSESIIDTVETTVLVTT